MYVFVVSMVLCASVNVCVGPLRSGAFLEHHDSSFLEVDQSGPRTDRNPPADSGCPEAPLQWATGGPGHLRREDTLSLCQCRVRP